MSSASCSRTDGLLPLHDGVVYGPVTSRRLGVSLGVNILPPGRKVCSFNCVYCQYGWTDGAALHDLATLDWPAADGVVADVERRLEDLALAGTHVDRVTLAGHGEPTLHPDFPAIVEGLREARDRVAASSRIAILSNSSTAGDPRVRASLLRLDERYMKLDAGDQDTLRHVNATASRLDDIVRALASVGPIVVQTMFVRSPDGRVDNSSPGALAPWLGALATIRPSEVHIYSLDRAPAWRVLEAIPRARLAEIARAVEQRGFRAEVF